MKRFLITGIFLLFVLQLYAQSRPTQGYSYSKKPLEVMGFTSTTTMTQVKNSLANWGIKWNAAEAKEAKNVIQIRGVRYEGCLFQVINFGFNDRGKLERIDFLPDDSESNDKIYNCFSVITKGYPYRNIYTISSLYFSMEYHVFNGYDDTEFAIWNNTMFYFGFCFNGSIYKNYGIYP